MKSPKDMNLQQLALYPDHKREAADGLWYKEYAKRLDRIKISDIASDVKDRDRLIANYKLYNNRVDINDLISSSVVKDTFFSSMPIDENIYHIDIISLKIKYLQGIARNSDTKIKFYAVNPEATTRKEEERAKLYREYVITEITSGINDFLTQKYGKQVQQLQQAGEEEALAQLMQQIEQERQAMTPEEIEEYMHRKHQDPAEILAQQLYNYLEQKINLKEVFSEGWKHGLISAREIYKVDIENGEPIVRAVNPLHIYIGGSNDIVQDNDYVIHYEYLTVSEILRRYGDRMDIDEFKRLIEDEEVILNSMETNEDFFKSMVALQFDEESDGFILRKIPVIHYVWKAPRKIGFLKYLDPVTKNVEERIVTSEYKLDKNVGDISIEWKYIIDVYEIYRVGFTDYWFGWGRVRRIFDEYNLNYVSLPYIGWIYDGTNSESVSIVDRLKSYQYLYDLVFNDFVRKLSQNKGRKLLMNISMIPSKYGYDVDKWIEQLEKLGYGFYDSSADGMSYQDINQNVREVDMSYPANELGMYINILKYIDVQAGLSIGLNEQTLGMVKNSQLVGTAQIAINQSLYVIEPYLSAHNFVRNQVALHLIDAARYAYVFENDVDKLQFAIDDISTAILKIDRDLLFESTYGIFPSQDTNKEILRQNILQLAQASLQNQQASLSEIIDILRTDSLSEAYEKIKAAEERAQKRLAMMQQSAVQAQQQQQQLELQGELQKIQLEGEYDIKKTVVREEERRKTELQRQAMLTSGFLGVDTDKDGTPDYMEIYRKGAEADIKLKELELEERKQQFEQQYKMELLKLEKEKLKLANSKKSENK